jgi:hypothetical protein
MITALRRAATSRIALVIALVLVSAGVAAAASTFWGETQSSSTFAGGWIGPPTAPATPVPTGYNADLAWTPGTHGPVTGQQLWSFDNGTISTCTGVTYAFLATMASAATSSYTATNTSAVNGHWLCYRIVSTSASAWTSAANFAPTQLGLVAKTVAIASGGQAGKMSSGDTITITFNQNVASSSVPASFVVCTGTSATLIIIADTHATNCNNTSDPYTIGVINGITVSGGKQKLNSSAVVSGATVTITIGQNGQNATGSGTFTPATSILSATLTNQASACVAANCLPTTTGSF